MNLDIYSRVGKHMGGPIQSNWAYKRHKLKDRREIYVLAVRNIQPKKTETHRTRLNAGGGRLSRRGQRTNIRLDHHENRCKQLHIRRKIHIHVHGRNIFLPEQPYGQGWIHHDPNLNCRKILSRRKIIQWINICKGNKVKVWTTASRTDITVLPGKTHRAMWIPPLKQKYQTMETKQSTNKIYLGGWWFWI